MQDNFDSSKLSENWEDPSAIQAPIIGTQPITSIWHQMDILLIPILANWRVLKILFTSADIGCNFSIALVPEAERMALVINTPSAHVYTLNIRALIINYQI